MANAKIRAEIDHLTTCLYDWHAGRINEREFTFRAGECASADEIARVKAIGKYSYSDRDGLQGLVAKAYMAA